MKPGGTVKSRIVEIMSTFERIPRLFRCVWILTVFVSQFADAATLESINPQIVQNDSNNIPVTFTITNVPVGGSVTVEKFADLNNNAEIDAGEPLVHSFTVTDGQVPLIGGVRNINVAGDDDGVANGQIIVHETYPSVGTVVSRIAGNYCYRLSGQAFLMVFEVTQNLSLQQGVMGAVTAAQGGQPLGDIPVVLEAVNGNQSYGTFADASGHYVIYAPPGLYTVQPVAKGFVSNQVSDEVTVSTNQFVTENLALDSASLTISGTVKDAATGVGIPGIAVTGTSSTNLVVAAFSDSTGAYSLMVTAGTWSIKPDQDSLAELGYVGPKKTTLAINSSTVQDLAVQKATALFWGTVTDEQQHAVTIRVEGTDSANAFKAVGRSFGTGGLYTAGIVADTWNLEPDASDAMAQGFASPDSAQLDISNGQALRQDFVLQSQVATPTPTLTLVQTPTVTATHPPSPTPSATSTKTAIQPTRTATFGTPLPTSTPGGCVGDCDGNRQVGVDELVKGVNIALDNLDVSQCPAIDCHNDHHVTIDCLVQAVNNALSGCGS